MALRGERLFEIAVAAAAHFLLQQPLTSAGTLVLAAGTTALLFAASQAGLPVQGGPIAVRMGWGASESSLQVKAACK